MKNQEFPRFIQNTPHGVDKYEGNSADRIAIAIKNHIKEYNDKENLAKIIGLDGKWGSGKSNIIKILKNKLDDNYYLFEYDAWGNQEDLQRRSFLEQLTKELIEKSILEGMTTISKRDGGQETVLWNEKLKYLLAQKKETISEKYPRISNGMAAAGAVAILTPIFVFIAYALKSHLTQWWWSLFSVIISMIPLLGSLVVWCIARKKDKRYKDLGYLLAIYNDKIENDVNYETISENEPSVSEFKGWMNDISNFIKYKKKNKLIIVFDNMDRLPADKVKQLWSSIHTFFSENGYKNIWVIIPYDKLHLANAFGEESNNKQLDLTCHFINKTFPVIYRVAPPIITDWKKAFNDFFDEAFTKNEDKSTILSIFGICKEHITPREIIAFINEIVSLKKTWVDEIPLLYISVFALKKDIILENPVSSILSGSYLGIIEKIVPNNEELQKNISALTFGIDVKLAEQIPLKNYLQKILKGQPDYDINKYTDNKHFVSILDDEIKNINPVFIESAIISLSKLNPGKGLIITQQWNELVKLQLNQEILSLSFTDSNKALLLNADDDHKKIFSEYLYNSYLKQNEFKGSLFYTSMDAFENFIKTNSLKISLAEFILNKNVAPNIFIDYVSQAKSRYIEYKIICENDILNNYLIREIQEGLLNMDFINYLTNDNNFTFTKLQEFIEKMISKNDLTETNFPELLKAYKLISNDKPLTTQLTSIQVNKLISTIKDKSQPAYYDLVAMDLVINHNDTVHSDGLDEEIAKVIEHYMSYGKLLLLSKDLSSDLLRKTVKEMTIKSIGTKMQILEVLQFFEEIKEALNITPKLLLNELSRFEQSVPSLTVDNIEVHIPKFNFYKYSTETKTNLTDQINKVAIEKLKTIPKSDLYAERNTSTYYWLNCAAILIENDAIESLPDNLTEFSKEVLVDIASGAQSIPDSKIVLGTIIKKASKSVLQPTIKKICDDFCNIIIPINPSLFVYFVQNFDFINIMTSRSGDITRNILNNVISDSTCLNVILDNSSIYINKINQAGDDSADLKTKIYNMLLNNQTDKLIDFAAAIGVKI